MANTGPTTYAALFADPSNDPCGDDPTRGYEEIFARWRVDNNPPSAAELHRDVLTDFDSTVGAVGYFVQDTHSESGVLKIAHGFRRFAGLPGRASPHRGDTFAYVGDVVEALDVETFKVDEQQFELVTETRCANTPERHQELFDAEPDQDVVPPIDSSSQAQKMTKTRRSMFIPFCLVEYVLDKDLSAREAFEILWPVILQKNLRAVAKPLVKFLMVAATEHTARSAPRTVNARLGWGLIGSADVLSDRRNRVLYQHLPALKIVPTTATVDPQMTELVTQLAQLNTHARLDRADRQKARTESTLPTTIRANFGDYVTDKLLKLTERTTDDDLPWIYHELAARTKGVSKRMLLQQSFDITASALKLEKLPASPSHVIDLDNWDFTGTSYDALGSGLLPFSVIPPDAPSKQGRKALIEDSERTRLYDMSGEAVNGAITPADAKKLYNAKGYIPAEWTEATVQIEQYAVILGTVLGDKHPAVTHYLATVVQYNRIKTWLQAGMNHKFGTKIAPALLVLYFQLNVRSWLEERWEHDMPDNGNPDLLSGLRLYTRSNRFNWLPSYDDIAVLTTLDSQGGGDQPVQGAGNNRAGSAGGGVNRAPAAQIQNRVQNPNRDPRYVGNTPFAVNVRTRSIRNAITVAGRDPPQVTRNGQLMPTCLSWHVKGSCSKDCTRKNDHVDNTAEECEALYQWCLPAFA